MLCWFISLGVIAKTQAPNVLFIMVDDLRVELGAYGSKDVISPNIDKISQQGTIFSNAYANVAVCGASRASLLTGLRPTNSRFLNYYSRADEDTPDAITLPELFKSKGYRTISYGKIFHDRSDTKTKSWTEAPWMPSMDIIKESKTGFAFADYQKEENKVWTKRHKLGPSIEMVDVPDEAYFDGQMTTKAIQKLGDLAKSPQPFFFALGYVKPHLPFTAPKKYWDMYDPTEFELAKIKTLPQNAPKEAYHAAGELRHYSDIAAAPAVIDEAKSRQLIHGYHASITYIDKLIGDVLQQLDLLGLRENTIVVLLGDHGWSLGEHGLWCKHSTFDVATKTPLIISAPGLKPNQNVKGLVEFIDIYPTVANLANIEIPKQVAGVSLLPLLKSPNLAGKLAVFPRWKGSEVIRTERYALTQWFNEAGKLTAQMLYDHKVDPSESINVADEPQYQAALNDLSSQLQAHLKHRQ